VRHGVFELEATGKSGFRAKPPLERPDINVPQPDRLVDAPDELVTIGEPSQVHDGALRREHRNPMVDHPIARGE
jgi:hypothetical protein